MIGEVAGVFGLVGLFVLLSWLQTRVRKQQWQRYTEAEAAKREKFRVVGGGRES